MAKEWGVKDGVGHAFFPGKTLSICEEVSRGETMRTGTVRSTCQVCIGSDKGENSVYDDIKPSVEWVDVSEKSVPFGCLFWAVFKPVRVVPALDDICVVLVYRDNSGCWGMNEVPPYGLDADKIVAWAYCKTPESPKRKVVWE